MLIFFSINDIKILSFQEEHSSIKANIIKYYSSLNSTASKPCTPPPKKPPNKTKKKKKKKHT